MNATVDGIVREVRRRTDFVPKVALTLGSGLGGFAERVRDPFEISYQDLPGLPVSTAPGHDGKFIFGYVGNVPVVCMKGRVHLYEGYPVDQVVLPARVMHGLGASVLFLTNACGGIGEGLRPGTLALVTDHISCFVPSPLIGPNDDDEGVRFPDMTHAYDPELGSIIERVAHENNIELGHGVYAQLTGPCYETPAEIRMLKGNGADLVGMSTVVEAIVGAHMGMRVCCVSLVTNYAAGISPTPLSAEEVFAAANEAEPRFTCLVEKSIEALGEK